MNVEYRILIAIKIAALRVRKCTKCIQYTTYYTVIKVAQIKTVVIFFDILQPFSFAQCKSVEGNEELR